VKINADLGIVVDPDVDRLAIINEVGEPFVKNIPWWPWPIISCRTNREIQSQFVLYTGAKDDHRAAGGKYLPRQWER